MEVILIADDGSQASRRAVRWAANNLPVADKRVVLLHVAAPPATPMSGSGLVAPDVLAMNTGDTGDTGQELVAEIKENLTQTRKQANLPPDTELRVVWGDPATEIVVVAKELNADLVVMGSRGRGFLGRVILGSVSSHVVHHAGLPVLVIPPQSEDADTKTAS